MNKPQRWFITLLALLACSPAAFAQTPEQSAYYTEPYQQKALEIYRKVIGWRTAKGHGQVPEMAAWLAEQFRAGGFAKEDIHLLPFTLPDGEKTAGLVVRYRGDGSAGRKPILLNAHMDVVDALPEDWERDPFDLVEEEGYFFGRGALDNKFGITMLTSTFLRLRAEGFVPTRDLIIAFNGDEETLMSTTRALVTQYRELTDAEFALNADAGGGFVNDDGTPAGYLLQTAEKTYATFEITVRNPGGHSSLPRADNAIYELADALKKIQAHRFAVQHNDTTLSYFRQMAKVVHGDMADAMRRFAENPNDREAADMLNSQPSQVGIIRTTCIATMLRGGHAENALPQSATATVNCRIFPGVDVSAVQAELQQAVGNDAVEFVVLDDPKASPASPLNDEVTAAVMAAVHARYPGLPIIPYQAPYGTDGKEIRAAGIPTYGVMGVFVREGDDFAHGLNERVEVKAFYGALEHWRVMLGELAGR